jgi:hypothetical protein
VSEPDGRHLGDNASTGSSRYTGTPLPGQPLADQPTETLHTRGHDRRQDTVVGAVPAAHPAPQPEDDAAAEPGFWQREDTRRDDTRPGNATTTQPVYRDAPVVVRRADSVAGLLLLLAGIAAGVSLLVVWVHGGVTGVESVRDGVSDLGDPQRLADRNSWEPLAVVFGGAALFLLGLLVFVPARSHRFLGVLALLVSLVVVAGVLVPLADAKWDVHRWAVGGWFTVAVAGLGFLGALKALMTGHRSSRA